MSRIRVGFIGTGKKPEKAGLKGYAMAYQHAKGYAAIPDCEIVACADLVKENGDAFAMAYGFEKVYTDYHQMLAKEKLDIVSICTWPKLHAVMTIDCIKAGAPAIHCEKPMALTFGECREMLRLAEENGTKLTFNHQRRFGKPFRKTKELLDKGEIGRLIRMEAHVGDLYDGGCHWVDMMNYFNNETSAEWVIGQMDCREVKLAFGAPCEHQSVTNVKYKNGVTSITITGPNMQEVAPPLRMQGTDGVIEIGWSPKPGPMLRYWKRGEADWGEVDCQGENFHGPGYVERAIADIVDCYKTGRESELCAKNEFKAMEIVFGCYESARRRGRVDLPMDISDSPIIAMLESGELKPSNDWRRG
ncbi:MAG: Gfo/Idh/MocA family oxidoreductase [Planctomycetota bacterium]